MSVSSLLAALAAVVIFLLIGGTCGRGVGSCRCGRPHWRRWQLQLWSLLSSLSVAAAAAVVVVVFLISSGGSCSWCCGHPHWQQQQPS